MQQDARKYAPAGSNLRDEPRNAPPRSVIRAKPISELPDCFLQSGGAGLARGDVAIRVEQTGEGEARVTLRGCGTVTVNTE